jgi:hypothetical protein
MEILVFRRNNQVIYKVFNQAKTNHLQQMLVNNAKLIKVAATANQEQIKVLILKVKLEMTIIVVSN